MTTRYRSRAAAEHAAKVLKQRVPQARVEVTPELGLVVWCYEGTLTPAQWELVSQYETRRPAAPDPSTPLLQPRPKRPVAQWARSKVKEPAKVCLSVCERYHASGRIDDRLAILAELKELGVTPNTAKTYYARYRESVGLPKVTDTRRKQSTVALTDKRPPIGRRTHNGVHEPTEGLIARELWDTADALYRSLGRRPTPKEVGARLPSMSAITVGLYLTKWRKFHDIP